MNTVKTKPFTRNSFGGFEPGTLNTEPLNLGLN